MKSLLLAAAAIIAVPAIAQETPAPTTDQTAPATDTMPPPADPSAPPPADASMPAPAPADGTMPAPAPADSTMTTGGTTGGTTAGTMPAPAGDPNAVDPAGGYQPSTPPIQGAAAPGATVRFQPAPDPNTAYPPPPPLKSYPVCKKGQYDNCRNPGGK